MEKKIAREPMLANRVTLRIHFAPLTDEELIPVRAQMHPILAATPERLLVAADTAYRHGVLRPWSHLLRWLMSLGSTPDNPPTKQQLEQALTLMAGRKIRL